ncbi:hypothetical protein D3C77_197280 [compost metagenome]
MRHDAADVAEHHFPVLGRGGPHREPQGGGARHRIARLARQEGADGHDRAVRRRHVARHDALNRHDDGCARHDGVDGLFGHAAMAALADDLDLPVVDRGHHLAGPEVEFARLEAGNVVHAEHGVDGKALEQTVADHCRTALHRLFAGLEDQPHGAVEALRFGQVFGGAQQHGGMAVVAAQVPHARDARLVGQVVLFLDRQGVEVGPQADRRAALPDLERGDDAVLADAGLDLIGPQAAQRLGDVVRRAGLLHRKFRMAMHMLEPFGHLGAMLLQLLDDGGHQSGLLWNEQGQPRPGVLPRGTVVTIDRIATATITRLARRAKKAASREARLVWLPEKVITPSIQRTPSLRPAIAV